MPSPSQEGIAPITNAQTRSAVWRLETGGLPRAGAAQSESIELEARRVVVPTNA
jgi:hypothetical protein